MIGLMANKNVVYYILASDVEGVGPPYLPCWVLGEWNTETRCSLLLGGPGRSDKVKSIYKVGASVIFFGYSMH